ncbi:hypothetical protein L323_02110 [Ruminiclostridium papyrosolvens C7]|uniref:Uncharacterized protein n=1 Tax=Ruminiclostridium papyrosolvens C7 TaxID=1330534 RepID=U4R5G3_9FIRM|nr:hypothetical protein L323_02110 [Ruminiclostridium papyrosolvens C7]
MDKKKATIIKFLLGFVGGAIAVSIYFIAK